MPEVRFLIRWPDGKRESCYSPSTVVRDYFREGEIYKLDDFLIRARTALNLASERVRQIYGRPCSLALGQLARLETGAADFPAGSEVVCETILTET